jgi:hypothetical protein
VQLASGGVKAFLLQSGMILSVIIHQISYLDPDNAIKNCDQLTAGLSSFLIVMIQLQVHMLALLKKHILKCFKNIIIFLHLHIHNLSVFVKFR